MIEEQLSKIWVKIFVPIIGTISIFLFKKDKLVGKYYCKFCKTYHGIYEGD